VASNVLLLINFQAPLICPKLVFVPPVASIKLVSILPVCFPTVSPKKLPPVPVLKDPIKVVAVIVVAITLVVERLVFDILGVVSFWYIETLSTFIN